MEFADFAQARGNLVGRRNFGRPDLLPQQLLVDQAIESGFAFFDGKRIRGTAIHERLKRQFLFPIALQQDVTVYVGDHPVHDLACDCGRRQRYG
jgi:hypothetical protein